MEGGRSKVTSNLPARNGKGSVYEGGVRVPGIIRWPGVTRAGSTNVTPIISMDYLPTVLEIVGLKPTNLTDGRSLVPLLKGQTGDFKRSDLFWHYPHYHSMGGVPYTAVRSDRNVADARPVIAKRLKSKIDLWRTSVGAQMPTANPDYDPSKPTDIRFGNNKARQAAPYRRD